MKAIHTQGVVLRYTNIKESDRMLTFFSPEYGKLSVLARGCRKPKSKLLPMSELFAYGEAELQPYRDIYILSRAEIRDAYFDIRNDLDRLACATYILNLTEETATTGEGNYPLFTLLLHGLAYLSYSDMDSSAAMLVYEIKLLDLIGYRPELYSCVSCGGEISEHMVISPELGGLLCKACSNNSYRTFSIDMDTIKTIRYILNKDMPQIMIPIFPPRIKEQLNRILPAYIEEKLEKKFKSRYFLDSFFTPKP